MKGNISRDSHRSEDHFSGVFQVQGGMVTDADLGEQAKIARDRTDALGSDTARCGVPVDGGAVVLDAGGPRLAEGIVYADGIRGQTRATAALTGRLSLYDLQRDFPRAPALPQNGDLIVYVDVWERMVSRLEEPLLTDAGLHGAETAFRSRTMAQVKFAPLSQAGMLGKADGPVPGVGGGVLSITPVDPETIGDDCDPCAQVVDEQQTVANALFRIEVVHVFGDPQTPDRIAIAWSAENGSAIAPADVNAEDFSRSGAVYEFFSYTTETHLGVHTANADVARSSFAATLAGGPQEPNAPDGNDWPFVRRWDGAAAIDFAASSMSRVGGGGGVAVTGRRVTITVDAFSAEIDFNGRPVVAGDYWLIEMRRFAEQPVRAVSTLPIGIRHHYCALFRVSDGDVVDLNDGETRRLSFPALADIPATHVGFDNECAKLYGDAENVQDALGNLCDITAEDIPFDPSDCQRLFDDADNVQDALINLCNVDFGTERLLRLLHDWGVVCGVVPSLDAKDSSVVDYTAGAILDRAGTLGDVKGASVDVEKLVATEFFHFKSADDFDKRLRSKDVCLALAIGDGGVIETHLAPRDVAFAPEDPTFLSVFSECREQRPPFDPRDDFSVRPDAERFALDKVAYAAANPKLGASQRLDAKEQKVARKYSDEVVARYKTHLNDAEQAKLIDQRIKQIDDEIDAEGATGAVRETRFLQREALVYALVKETEAERVRRCLCNALMPRCPTIGKPPHLVPIACLEGVTDGRSILLRDVCVFSCRKQAMSWRMVEYYFSEVRDRLNQSVIGVCCPPVDDQGPVRPKPKFDLDLSALDQRLTPEFVGKEAEKSLRILTGRNPPNDYKVKPKVEDLGVDQAKFELTGNGVDVVQTIDADDANAIRKLREASVGVNARDLVTDDGAVGPGDKVALIVQEGVAIDYVKLETGAGKFIFDKPAAAGVSLSDDARTNAEVAVADLEARLKAAEDAAVAADTDLVARLDTRRSEIEKDADQAEAELAALRASHAELNNELTGIRSEIDTARAQLTQLRAEQKTLLEETAKERDAVITSIRRETPVSAVVDEEKLTVALAKRGVTNISGLAELPDSELTAAAREAGVNLNSARRMKREAGNILTAPLR